MHINYPPILTAPVGSEESAKLVLGFIALGLARPVEIRDDNLGRCYGPS